MKDITFKNLTDEQINAIKVLLGDACEIEEQEGEENFPFPSYGGEYYFIDSTNEVCHSIWSDDEIEIERLSLGNCFETREKAEFMSERLKVLHDMKRFTEPKNYAWDGQNNHYYFYYDYLQGDIKIGNTCYYKYNSIYFESKVNAQNCMSATGEDRIKKYYFGIKEGDKE